MIDFNFFFKILLANGLATLPHEQAIVKDGKPPRKHLLLKRPTSGRPSAGCR
jgi:hypothetical protein